MVEVVRLWGGGAVGWWGCGVVEVVGLWGGGSGEVVGWWGCGVVGWWKW